MLTPIYLDMRDIHVLSQVWAKFFKILCTNYMTSSEGMTSSAHSFAYSYQLVKKCFVKICETSKVSWFSSGFHCYVWKLLLFLLKFKLNLFRDFPFNQPLLFWQKYWLLQIWRHFDIDLHYFLLALYFYVGIAPDYCLVMMVMINDSNLMLIIYNCYSQPTGF